MVHSRWVPVSVLRILVEACTVLEERRVEERSTPIAVALEEHRSPMEEALEEHRSLQSVHNQMELLLVLLVLLLVEGSLDWGSRLAEARSSLA